MTILNLQIHFSFRSFLPITWSQNPFFIFSSSSSSFSYTWSPCSTLFILFQNLSLAFILSLSPPWAPQPCLWWNSQPLSPGLLHSLSKGSLSLQDQLSFKLSSTLLQVESKTEPRGPPWGSTVKTLQFHCRIAGLIPDQEMGISHTVRHDQINK